MGRIELADKTEFQQANVGYTGPEISLYMSKEDIAVHMGDLMDPNKIDPLTFYHGPYKDIYHGFERFSNMEQKKDTGEIIVRLRGENTHAEFNIPTVPVEYLPKEI